MRFAIYFLAVCALPLVSKAQTLDFNNGTWSHTQADGTVVTSTGFDSNFTSGSTTVNGITVTLDSLLHGTAIAGTNNFANTTTGLVTGFQTANQTGSVVNAANGTLQNYQEWRISFSEAVDGVTWEIGDIDANGSGGAANRWIDAIAAESFLGTRTAPVGSDYGTGNQVTFDLSSVGNELENVTDLSDYGIPFIARDALLPAANQPSDDPRGIATLNTNGALDSFSIYYFNRGAGNTTGQQGIVPLSTFSFSAVAVPEPTSVAMLLGLAGGYLLRRRRR